jgi:hypothetical protein
MNWNAGQKRVSVFWLYFVAAFGCLFLFPCFYFDKNDMYLPLVTYYVDPYSNSFPVSVLVRHLLASLLIATVLLCLHKLKRSKSRHEASSK